MIVQLGYQDSISIAGSKEKLRLIRKDFQVEDSAVMEIPRQT